MVWPSTGVSGSSLTDILARVDRDIANGTDGVHYWHNLTDLTLFTDYIAAIKARVDAGLLTVKPMHERIAEVRTFKPLA
jgi:hypothetical protein